MGDFNLTVENKNIKVFMSTFDLKCVIKKHTNFLKFGISDHHSFTDTVLRRQLIKGNVKMMIFRDYSSFQMEHFKAELNQNLKSNTSFEYSQF